MKLLFELAIIFLITLMGEILSQLIPLGIPASIIALALLLLLLFTKLLKIEQIELSGSWFLSNMAIFFIPPCVSIIEHTNLLLSAWWQILVISILSFFFTFIAAGYTVIGVQKLIKKREVKNAK